jgi:hypothetical protein
MYVDEVGNPDLRSSDNPNHRFLSLTGVVVELTYVQSTVYAELERLKSQFLSSHPDDPVVLHRKDMVNQRGAFRCLKDEQVRESFDSTLLAMLSNWDYTVITVCIDKKRHRDTYTTWRYDPYHYCLAVLLERFIYFLHRNKVQGDVMAESRGGREDRRLKVSFQRLWEEGTDYLTADRIQMYLTSKQLKVKPKANNISGLQSADILAHPSRNEILVSQGVPGVRLAPFAEKVVAILQTKYDRYAGKIEGVGKKYL